MSTKRNLPLTDIKVLDFSQVQFGPMATQILGDYGADVIKVERPHKGDISRSIDVLADSIDDSAIFLSLNRNKRSIALDLKKSESLDIIYNLLETTDVLVENFRPGVADRIGIGYEALKEMFPRLIFASGSGYGQEGPLRKLGGQDIVAQAISGASHHHRGPDGRPAIYPIPFVDFGSGMALVQGVLLALLERGKSGLGQHIEVSLLDTAIFAQMQEYTQWMMRDHEINWERDNLIGSFKAKDGWVTIVGLFRPNPLKAICSALEIEDLTQWERFSTAEYQRDNRKELWSILDAALEKYTMEEAVEQLSGEEILCGPVLDYDSVIQHPQVVLNGSIRTVDHPVAGRIKLVDGPIRMSAASDRPFVAPPLLGEHTLEVLTELGYDSTTIEKMITSGLAHSSAGDQRISAGPKRGLEKPHAR